MARDTGEGGDARKTKPRIDPPALDRTILEMAVTLNRDEDDEAAALGSAFDRGLGCLRGLQRAYYLAEQRAIRLITRELLPVLVPYGVRRITDDRDDWPVPVGPYLLNQNLDATFVAPISGKSG
jgi:hypothetical protein